MVAMLALVILGMTCSQMLSWEFKQVPLVLGTWVQFASFLFVKFHILDIYFPDLECDRVCSCGCRRKTLAHVPGFRDPWDNEKSRIEGRPLTATESKSYPARSVVVFAPVEARELTLALATNAERRQAGSNDSGGQ